MISTRKELEKEKTELLVIPTPPFKLKDRPANRIMMPINLERQFGFKPETIIIEKVYGRHDTIIVKAVLTEDETRRQKLKGKIAETKNDK